VTAERQATPLLRAVIANAGKLTGGRLALAMLRFAATLVLVQRAGMERFGEFALMLSFILLAEWLSDFGLSDIAVRQIAADPRRRPATLGAFGIAKLAQGLLAALLLWGGVWLAGYGVEVVRSAMIAGAAVLVYVGVQVYRVEFRSRQQMGRDTGAEVVAAMVFLLAIWVVTGHDASLETLTLCYVLSRAVNLAAAAGFARGWPRLGFDGSFRSELRVLAVASIPLGFTGLMVCTYEAMAQIALSQWSTSEEVGIYAFGMRAMMLALVAEQALATAVFPLLATQWAKDRPAFVRTMQTVMDWGLLISGAFFCFLHTGAPWLVSLVKDDSHAIADVLQLLSWAIPARVAVALVGPMLVISGRLIHAVWIPVLVVAAKWMALTVFAPQGAYGAAIAFLIAEIGVGLLPNLFFCQWASGVWLRWSVPARVVAYAVAVVAICAVFGFEGGWHHAVLATGAYLLLVSLLGGIRMQTLTLLVHSVLRRRHDNP